MFSHLSFDIRLLIWEEVLRQPRVVYINLRQIPEPPPEPIFDCESHEPTTKRKPICTTPVPVLLHLCTETRILALAHYELTFGCGGIPIYNFRRRFQKFSYNRPSSIEGTCPVVKRERTEAEKAEDEADMAGYKAAVANHGPKIYFNFQYDTLLFGQTWSADGKKPDGLDFGYENHFVKKDLQKIETLAMRIEKRDSFGDLMLFDLDRLVRWNVFPRLKKLYFCLEDDNLNPSRGVELVDFMNREQKVEGDEEMIQRFLDMWKTSFKCWYLYRRRDQRQPFVLEGVGMEALKSLCRIGLDECRHYETHLKTLLLKNGAGLDELPKFAWVRNQD